MYPFFNYFNLCIIILFFCIKYNEVIILMIDMHFLEQRNMIFQHSQIEQRSITEKGISIKYPYIEGIKDGDAMERYVLAERETFLKHYQDGYQLMITYDQFQSQNYLGFIFYVLEDTHGAHPNTHIKTFNYVNEVGKEGLHPNCNIELIDVKKRYTQEDLNFFSEYAKKELKPKLEENQMYIEEMFEAGIAPTFENFQNIIELDNEIIIYFQQYQIAPYVMGIMNCRIPKILFM